MTEPQKNAVPDGLQLIGAGQSFRQELCDLIAATQMFNDFDWRDVETLSDYMQAYQAPAGTTLFREGEAGEYMCLIIKGKVDVLKKDQNDHAKVVASIGSGKTLGEMAIVDGEPRSATALVAGATTLTILTKANFLRIVAEKPTLAAKILLKIARLLSQRLRQTSGLLVDYLDG